MTGLARSANDTDDADDADDTDDAVAFCPGCGARLDARSFQQEYWVADDRHVVCWCAACGLTCTVVLGTLVGTEPDH